MEISTVAKNIKIIVTIVVCVFFTLNSFSQYSTEFETYSKAYPNAHFVRLNDNTTIIASIENGKIKITQEFLEEDLYLDESATNASKRALNFSSFFELNEINASSYTYIKNKYVETKVENFLEKDDLDRSFYDDTKTLSFIYPNLKKGAKSKLYYSENVTNPRFLSPFYFGSFFPIINSKVILIADKNISFDFIEFNTENVHIVFTKEEKRKTIIYTWELKNIHEYKYESDVPTYKNVFPHIIPIITSYKTSNGNTIEVLGDVSDLYKWYYSLVKNINKEDNNAELVELVKSITTNKTTEIEKVRAIYYWAQKNIKYIAFEYALGGFVPREANDVFKKKYGDCKDNSSILLKMLEIADIKGDLTWIGTRSIPYKYNEVPTPIVDNHMILSYQIDGEIYFLDATGRYIPLELPTSFIQGKEALISKGGNDFEVVSVPIIPANKNAIIDSTEIALVNQNVVGVSKTEISGYRKINYFNALETKNTDDKLKGFYNVRLRKGNNKFLIDSLSETNKYDYDKNLIVNYTFNINSYANKVGDEIYVNLNLNKTLLGYKTEKDREYDIEYTYKSAYNYITTLNIPQGYSIEYLPENNEASNDYISSKTTYTVEDNQIVYNHFIELNFLSLNIEQQKDVNDLIKKAQKGYKEIVVLKKTNTDDK